MKVLVCCGATVPFNGLVLAFTDEIIQHLRSKGYDAIDIQYGHAAGAFSALPPSPSVNGFAFDPKIRDKILTADLVISHAGTGSLLDALRSNNHPKVIAVINESLMDNHQAQVAHQLSAGGHIIACTPTELKDAIDKVTATGLVPLKAAVPLDKLVPELAS